jgi:Flp pilus assembly protein TadG
MKLRRGQGLLEFALVAPILLFMLMGIFDFSRVLITYTIASNSLRDALRLAEVRGADPNNPMYLNCAAMRARAGNVLFAGPANPTVVFLDVTTDPPTPRTCSVAQYTPASAVKTGDILRMTVNTSVRMITPLISNLWPSLTINLTGQRTIVAQVQLGSAANVAADSDFDGLNDAWESAWFGTLARTGTEDPDNDGCNNGCEETRNSNPTDPDTDNDNIPDGQEAQCETDLGSGSSADVDNDGLNANLECQLSLDDNRPDFDGDGLLDGYEHLTSRTNPALVDSDGDTLSDGAEINTHSSNPLAADTDVDCLNDPGEISRGSNVSLVDSDRDGLTDGEEAGCTNGSFAGWSTNPLVSDTDSDGLGDGYELMITDSAPRVRDSNDTDPTKADSDSDGLNDASELLDRLTNPNLADTDGDNLKDGDEIAGTAFSTFCNMTLPPTNPLNPNTDGDSENDDVDCSIASYDSDADGLADAWEMTYFGGLTFMDGTGDPDGDLCTNECEETRLLNPIQPDTDLDGITDGREALAVVTGYTGTNPLDADSDGDIVKDGDEIANSLNPLNRDSDGDRLSDGQELRIPAPSPYSTGLGTSATNPDTDGDGLTDYEEVARNDTDPMTRDGDDTDPLSTDTDLDALNDGAEVLFWFTNPRVADTDSDGLSDGAEVQNGDTAPLILDANDTNPTIADTDGDGLNDGQEVLTYITNPRDEDTDNDRLTDLQEVNFTLSYTVNGAAQTENRTLVAPFPDMDSDGVPNGPRDPDSDGDGISDGDEALRVNLGGQLNPTNPYRADTDGDTRTDRAEVNFSLTYTINELQTRTVTISTDPTRTDTDSDGLSDGVEINGTRTVTPVGAITDPTLVDSDADGVNDRTDNYPNYQPTIQVFCVPAGCATTEPVSPTNTANHTFRIQADYVNAGQAVPVRWIATDGTAISGTGNPPPACATNANRDYHRRIPPDNELVFTGSGSPAPQTATIVICRDNITLTGSPLAPRTDEALTEQFTVQFGPQADEAVFIRPDDVPPTFTVTINSR